MRFLILSRRGESAGIGLRLKSEGHEVYLWIKEQPYRRKLQGILETVRSVAEGEHKSPDAILIDGSGIGGIAEALRERGWPVVGGGKWHDKLETEFGVKTLEAFGIRKNEKSGTDLSVQVWYANGKPVPQPLGCLQTRHFLTDDLGPSVGGEVVCAWAYDRKEPRLVQQTTRKLHPFLERIRYTGPITIHGVASKGRFYASRICTSIGSTFAFLRVLDEPLGPFLVRIAKGQADPMKLKDGFGFSMNVSLSPYPWKSEIGLMSRVYQEQRGKTVRLPAESWGSVAFPLDLDASQSGEYQAAGTDGLVAVLTGYGISVFDAEDDANAVLKKLSLEGKQARADEARVFMRSISSLASQGYEAPPFVKPLEVAVVAPMVEPPKPKGVLRVVQNHGGIRPIFHQPHNDGPRSG